MGRHSTYNNSIENFIESLYTIYGAFCGQGNLILLILFKRPHGKGQYWGTDNTKIGIERGGKENLQMKGINKHMEA